MHLDVNQLITQYGYLALFLGCIAEGETFTLLGGIAVHEGLLDYGWVLAAAVTGGTLGDTALYLIGRRYGDQLLRRFKKYQPQIDKAQRLIHQYPGWFVIGVRFMYGLRIAGPIIIGASKLKLQRFLLLNVAGAVAWALIFVSLGYLGGRVIGPWLHKFDHHLKSLFWLVLVLFIVLVVCSLWRGKRQNQREDR